MGKKYGMWENGIEIKIGKGLRKNGIGRKWERVREGVHRKGREV